MAAVPPPRVAAAVPDERAELLDLVTRLQARPDRSIIYVGTEQVGIEQELDALSPPWLDTARVVRGEDGPVGLSIVEWEDEADRAWVLGPWVDGGRDEWERWAEPLVRAALEQVPDGMHDVEICGDVAHVDLAQLADGLGWTTGEVNHALVVDRAGVEAWPAAGPDGGVDRAGRDDAAAIAVLHDVEFPHTHTSAARLVADAADGGRVVLVVVVRGRDGLLGYAAGQVQPDGEGYVDYLGVAPAARRGGIGRRLATAVVREVLAGSTTGRVNLTVQDHRTPARALYAALGFVHDVSFVGHGSVPAG